MSIFEHVSVFVSIILGLAVVHLLGGLSLILDTRVRTPVYWVHLLWTANMLFLTSLVWLGNFLLAPVDILSVGHFLNMIAYSMVIYLMSGLLFPVRGGEITDFRLHFEANRSRFYFLGTLLVVTDALDGKLEIRATDVAFNPGQFGTLAVYLVLFLAGMRTTSARFHATVPVVFFLGLIGFLYSLVAVGIVAP